MTRTAIGVLSALLAAHSAWAQEPARTEEMEWMTKGCHLFYPFFLMPSVTKKNSKFLRPNLFKFKSRNKGLN